MLTKQFTTYYQSPLGLLEITGDASEVDSISFERQAKSYQEKVPSLLYDCTRQLDEYFYGKRRNFDLPLKPQGTFFQSGVWNELQKIPFGEKISYLELSRRIGDEKSIRAVGAANGRNPIAIIIPCHRVIGINQKLVGYTGGLWRKQWLLEHEEKFACGVLRLF
jgi:methylated-DNA-[protein]-cysteine S-methyltransferase